MRTKTADAAKLTEFKKTVWAHYKAHRRDMPWRHDHSEYAVVVSEIMLQQTQVPRVITKFESFTKRFPDWEALANASTQEVLSEWAGLGYNRRALYLHRIAKKVVGTYAGQLPHTYAELQILPGIGPNTAGSIMAFAFNTPRVFIETNIRSVFIHFFFGNTKRKIDDARLMPFIEATLDEKRPREWYWALMDYGSYLKSLHPNPSRRSAHHVKQSTFKGSNRELRAAILRALINKPASEKTLVKKFDTHDPLKVKKNLTDLTKEGFIEERRKIFYIVQ